MKTIRIANSGQVSITGSFYFSSYYVLILVLCLYPEREREKEREEEDAGLSVYVSIYFLYT